MPNVTAFYKDISNLSSRLLSAELVSHYKSSVKCLSKSAEYFLTPQTRIQG